MMECLIVLATIFTAIATCGLAYVAYKQVDISKNQTELSEQALKISLFEKRYEIYDGARNFLIAWMQKGVVRKNDALQYKSSFEKAEFLFGKDFYNFLNEVYRKSFRLAISQGSAEEVNLTTDEMINEGLWPEAKLKILNEKVKPFLNLSAIGQ